MGTRVKPVPAFAAPLRWSPENWRKGLPTEARPLDLAGVGNAMPLVGRKGGYVIVAGTFDTKGAELTYIRDRLRSHNLSVKTVDLSTSGSTSSADVPPQHVALRHPNGASAVFTGDRGVSVTAMSRAFVEWIGAAENVSGILSAAGSGGTALATPAMRALPIGVPKMMISTLAAGDIREYIGSSDIMMLYAVTDVQGINRISSKVLARGADILAGAVRQTCSISPSLPSGPALALTYCDTTSPAMHALATRLRDKGVDCMIFLASESGVRSMEHLVEAGIVTTVADLSPNDIGDLVVCKGETLTDRLGAIQRKGIPYIASVAGLDAITLGPPDQIAGELAKRLLFSQSPTRVLMRSSVEENRHIGRWIAERINRMSGPVRLLLPEGGLSALDAPGRMFWNPEANAALFAALRDGIDETAQHRIELVPHHVNSEGFARVLLQRLDAFSNKGGRAADAATT